MQLRAIYATILVLAAQFMALLSVRADCYSTYTNAAASCLSVQQNTDAAYWNLWNWNNNVATTTLNSYLALDLTNFRNIP
jgi:squalene cyclase